MGRGPCYPGDVRRALVLVGLAVQAGACDLGTDAAPVDAGIDGWPAPRADLVPAVGSATSLDVACWNLENFPKDVRTIGLVADLITSLDLDVVVVQEVASVVAWNELVERLPDHDGVLSSHRYTPTEYQKLGVLYRPDRVVLGEPELLFTGETYAFPRPPLKVRVTAGALAFDAIGVHLKAGTASDDGERRAAAMRQLEAHVRAQVDGGGEDEVIVLGDFNEVLTTSAGMAVLAPMLGAPERYRFRTAEAAAAGEATFLPGGRVIDHVVTSAGLADELGAARAVIPPLDAQLPRYDPNVSDHLPVVISIPTP